MVTLLMFGSLALVLGFVAVEIWALSQWDGGWRIAATVPGAAMLFVVARILIDTHRDPTSHNLWPFEVLIGSVVGLTALLVLTLARRMAHTRSHAA